MTRTALSGYPMLCLGLLLFGVAIWSLVKGIQTEQTPASPPPHPW